PNGSETGDTSYILRHSCCPRALFHLPGDSFGSSCRWISEGLNLTGPDSGPCWQLAPAHRRSTSRNPYSRRFHVRRGQPTKRSLPVVEEHQWLMVRDNRQATESTQPPTPLWCKFRK